MVEHTGTQDTEHARHIDDCGLDADPCRAAVEDQEIVYPGTKRISDMSGGGRGYFLGAVRRGSGDRDAPKSQELERDRMGRHAQADRQPAGRHVGADIVRFSDDQGEGTGPERVRKRFGRGGPLGCERPRCSDIGDMDDQRV